ncbi:MAG: type II toxin-antitoxin system HigB family toxin [Caldilinea sp. CFX5]|nr:type II toxin-antitoxin system HigB family toxin [Caldilinea sp. CFX5]
MRIISRKTLREFASRHPQAKRPLDDWYEMALRATWTSPADVKQIARSADILPDNRVVFNISGNHYRLVVKIEYTFRTIYIRFIGTHDDYDQIDATII